MATTKRTTPPQNEAFSTPNALQPRLPTSLSHSVNQPIINADANTPRPQSALKRPDYSPRPKTGYSPATTLQLTGQAAMADMKRRNNQQRAVEDARQTSPNPGVAALQSLMGAGGMSRPSDAPASTTLSEPLRKAAEKIVIPETTLGDSLQVSPVSMASFDTVASLAPTTTTAGTSSLTAGPQYTAEPGEMSETRSYPDPTSHLTVASEDNAKALSFSYPGPPQPPPQGPDHESGPSRGMSYPGPRHGSPQSPASSNKRHKCPYCSTDFTRHHNLKSHLLTHSQEKPYVCQTCQSRFRRLHDLKRHTKLHTGERPHICDKCGRKFARGDALARHNKGPGGCAGRRSSLGGEDDFGGDGAQEGMDGVEYPGADDDEDGDQEAETQREAQPSRKRAHVETPQDPNRQVYRQHSSTYPPIQAQSRPHGSSVSSMGPPTVVHPGSSMATSPHEMSTHPGAAVGSSLTSSYYGSGPPPGQVFAQQAVMTESPKPISPGQPPGDHHRLSVADATVGRNRSPSLATQFQQQTFGRGTMSRTPPQPPSSFTTVLPPLNAGQPRGPSTMQPNTIPGPGPSLLSHQIPQPLPSQHNSNPGSLSSHGRSSGSSMRDVMGQEPGDIWNYVRSLEQRFSRMQDEYELRISRLQEELISLKGHVSQSNSYSSNMDSRSY